MFGALYAVDGPAPDALLALAGDFTPRCEMHGPREVVLDLSGLERLFGSAQAIAAELDRAAGERQVRVQVGMAETCTAARLRAISGQWAVGSGQEQWAVGSGQAAIAALPIELLAAISDVAPSPLDVATFHRWGLRTIGDLAALPADAVAARLGPAGARWHRLACGEDLRPLRPEVPAERFEQALDLEWPIEGLEPLSFVLGRLLEPLAARLERRGRGAAALHLRLHLVTRAVHARSLQLPVPMRDVRTLRTLLLLDLESHPPAAAIDRVVVAVDPTPARVVQYSLLARPMPSTEQLSTLAARLAALMGEGRCGSPVVIDSWRPGAFAMKAFTPRDSNVAHLHEPRSHGATEDNSTKNLRVFVSPRPVDGTGAANLPAVALRRFRIPVPARVRLERGTPVHVTTHRRGLGGGRVQACAGPWRTSGAWWSDGAWDRDEWDVTLGDGATCRVFRNRATGAWFLEGTYD